MQRPFILSAFLFIAFFAHAQNINGIWKGKLVMDPGGCFPVYNIELQLQVAGTKISGVSYHYSDTTNYVKENFEGSYKTDSNNISIMEIGVTTFHIPADCIPCIKKYFLSYHKGGNEEQLRGSWLGRTMDNKMTCPPGTIVLTRFDKSAFKPELKLPPTLTERKAELVKEIKVDTGTIRLDFYDNGQIDGDTISVYVNNMPVVSNQMLTAKPISIKIKIDPKRTEQEVIMVGENLGSIPPNTALMIVNAGEKRYQLYLTSDEQKNAMVRFIYEKPVAVVKSP
ncbi:MAG TPA: hypothetical protein VKC90_10465 [Chitinophagaceae bacterium]|nr:hypothetical protein [Chitinophagaceae bacterium]